MSDIEKKEESQEKSEDTATEVPNTPDIAVEPDVSKGEGEVKEVKKGINLSSLKEAGKNMPIGPGNFWNNILSTVLLLVLLSAGYSYIVEHQNKPTELSISEVAQQVKAGEIEKIVVRGPLLEVSYKDTTRTEGEAKKERDSAVTETLSALGVSPDQLNAIKIDVQNETGFAYWLSNAAPFLFPILFLGIVIWFFSRSVKGAGMQYQSAIRLQATVVYD